VDLSTVEASRPISAATLTVRGQHQLSTLSGTDGNQPGITGQTADRQKPEFTGPFKIRTSAMTCGYYRTSSPVTALPMIMRWISDVPSKIVKFVEIRAVSAGRRPARQLLVSTNSAANARGQAPRGPAAATPVAEDRDGQPDPPA
jgi:hypothetical protein